jgi:predicted dehydrogenase
MSKAKKATFAIIGGGFRAGFFLWSAHELPEQFAVCGVVTSHPEKTAKLRDSMGVPVYETVDELLAHHKPDFLVACTMRSADTSTEPMNKLVATGLPILMETPAAGSYGALQYMYELCRDKKVQVAEQVHAQPETAARIEIARSGLLGEVNQVSLSFQQTYHCMNTLRRFLGIGFENAEIYARQFEYPVVQGYTRAGIADTEQIVTEKRTFALLDFNGKLGIYDYEANQPRSFVRSEHIAVRGERGEISDRTVRWLENHKDFRNFTYERLYAGTQTNLEGFYFRGLMGGGKWLFRNPYPTAHFSDEDIAITTMLEKMVRYIREGIVFSSIADACQDQYLWMMIEKSIQEGKPVRTETQVWATS